MNLTRAILEGLQEVELEITPEFQKEWPEPHVDNVKTVGKAPSGQSRHLVVLGWPNGAKVTALEVGDVEHGAELNVWAPLSTVKPGDWAHAIESIQKGITYTGGIYVYVQSYEDPIYDEIDDLVTASEALDAYTVISSYDVGEEPVVDYFLKQEQPASKQRVSVTTKKNVSMGSSVKQGVMLSDSLKLTIVNRPWFHVTHLNVQVNESNSVMVLTKIIPIEAPVEEKKIAVQEQINDIKVQAFWAEKIQAWKMWPKVGQATEEFERQIGFMIQYIDEVIDIAAGERES